MLVNWNEYLARYQQARGGWFFGGEDWSCDAQLVLPQEGKHPLLVNVYDANLGRGEVPALRGRTMVKLARDYTLHIRAKGLVGGGVSGVAGLLGRDMDFGYPEALGGRMVTTSDRAFTKLVLGSLELRNCLAGRKKEYLRVYPSPVGEGWHTVEAGPASLEGGVKGAAPGWARPCSAAKPTWSRTRRRAGRPTPILRSRWMNFWPCSVPPPTL